MALKSIQLATIDVVDRAEDRFSVTVHSDDGNMLATFACSSEHSARMLRDAIREHADRLHWAANYRERGSKATGGAA